MNWEEISKPSEQDTMGFKREMFNNLVHMMWASYKESGSSAEIVSGFLSAIEDFPELKILFNNYYEKVGEETLWSDKIIILRFLKRLTFVYESMEVES